MSKVNLAPDNLPLLLVVVVSLVAVSVFLFIPADSLDIALVYGGF